MTWAELKEFIDNLPMDCANKEVPIFVFTNGDMENLNLGCKVGQHPAIDSHCSDINENFLTDGEPYLLCGYNGQ